MTANTFAYETEPLVKPTGFRECDARWLFGKDINLMGLQALGMGLGALIHARGIRPDIVIGHDYRAYSAAVRTALLCGLMASGCRVHDIGLALTPMAYFAQFDLDVPCVAMVTASHNENGWTGVKIGCDPPLTFGPDEMAELREIVLGANFKQRRGGSLIRVHNFRRRYMTDLANRPKLKRRLKVVAACGNGTAGLFAPAVLEAIGCEVVPLDAEPDHTFPNHNPNPEDLRMLRALGEKVRASNADIGFGFDGDGDRCGVVDHAGREIFADKVGVLLARDLSTSNPGATIVVDVKSTALFATDPVLRRNRVRTSYWKTGHSHMKRRLRELGALMAFDRSGHFFFAPPYGRGYDDGLLSAIAVCEMLDRSPDKSIADLRNALQETWQSPTLSVNCPDETKSGIVGQITRHFAAARQGAQKICGQAIHEILTIDGVRLTLADGSWGLVRASSTKPELAIVVESPVSHARAHELLGAIARVLRSHPELGDFNQTDDVC